MLQERDEILSEPTSTAVEVIFVGDLNPLECSLLVGIKGLEPGIDVATPELLQHIGHFDCPNQIAPTA